MSKGKFPEVISEVPNNCLSAFLDGELERTDNCHHDRMKTMWIIRKVTDEELLDQPIPPEHNCHHLLSMEHSLLMLIRETQDLCSSYPNSFSDREILSNLRQLIYQGNRHFYFYASLPHVQNFGINSWDNFTSILYQSRGHDDGYKAFLWNCSCSGVSFELGVDDNIPFYIRRKLEPMSSLTILDAYIVANAYNAILTIYEIVIDGVETTCTYSLMNFNHYNHLSSSGPRPRWIILYDLGSKKFYPMFNELSTSAGYGFRRNYFNSYLIYRSLIANISELPDTDPEPTTPTLK